MSLAEVLAPVWAELKSIQKRLVSVSPATVTAVSPIRIQVDGQAAPVAASPDSLVPVGPGDRVRVLRYGTTHLILGVIGTAREPFAQAVGAVNIETDGSGYGEQTVTFPAGRFTAAPRVSLTPISTAATITMWAAYDASAAGFTARVYRSSPGGAIFMWHAIQMTPTSADG